MIFDTIVGCRATQLRTPPVVLLPWSKSLFQNGTTKPRDPAWPKSSPPSGGRFRERQSRELERAPG
eukprot:1214485-Heterocapsa_arctica.AAC.1